MTSVEFNSFELKTLEMSESSLTVHYNSLAVRICAFITPLFGIIDPRGSFSSKCSTYNNNIQVTWGTIKLISKDSSIINKLVPAIVPNCNSSSHYSNPSYRIYVYLSVGVAYV